MNINSTEKWKKGNHSGASSQSIGTDFLLIIYVKFRIQAKLKMVEFEIGLQNFIENYCIQ